MSIDQLGNRIHARVWGKLAQKNWTTWIDHTVVAAVVTGIGAGLGYPFGEWLAGARIFSLIALAYYWNREDLRTTLDSFGDRAGPTLVAVLTWLP